MDVIERIKEQIASNRILIYMKGTPDFPQCGFSARAVQCLKAVGAEFGYVNVLEEPEIRARLKEYSNWPTFPQVFVNGELVGGCDIVVELYQSGELKKLVDAAMGRAA
ncbi:MAG TPA: Grx4 family monothiol glutaredoxin [Gammaproteobacteria bacterium]|nr:Grx4 family monothiol glutaredoxin [Gammaproteobacteria bacterium]